MQVLMHVSQRCFLLGCIVVAFFLAGCAYNAESNATPPPTSTRSTSPTAPIPTAPTDSVTLQVGAASYQLGSDMSVTIKNQSRQAISFADSRTDCTVLLLERQGADSWEPVAPCARKFKPRLHSLKAGETLEVKFAISDQWPTGRYRARLDYYVGSEMKGGGATTVVSSVFRVG
jgi:hypothetical protein